MRIKPYVRESDTTALELGCQNRRRQLLNIRNDGYAYVDQPHEETRERIDYEAMPIQQKASNMSLRRHSVFLHRHVYVLLRAQSSLPLR